MNHWIVAPVLLPLITGALLLFLESPGLAVRRAVSIAATTALMPVAMGLMIVAATGEQQIYYLGDWPAPFGIVLVLDRLSALMLALTSVLASASLLYALGGDDSKGADFHALFQFQLLGHQRCISYRRLVQSVRVLRDPADRFLLSHRPWRRCGANSCRHALRGTQSGGIVGIPDRARCHLRNTGNFEYGRCGGKGGRGGCGFPGLVRWPACCCWWCSD